MKSPSAVPASRRAEWICATLFVAMLSGGGACSHVPASTDRATLAADLFQRTGVRIGTAADAGDFSTLRRGTRLTEQQAVDLALLNNAAFQERLADLGLTHADVVQAGLITNPDALLLIPVGAKQLEATVTAPLEALWLRDRRVEAARAASARTVASLTQAALDLVRDVRVAYADLVLARRRLALFDESTSLRERVSKIANARLEAGDALPLDVATARADVLRSRQEAKSLAHAVRGAEERLRHLIGSGDVRSPIPEMDAVDSAAGRWDVGALVTQARVDRPDVRAAEMAVLTARGRAALARSEWIGLSFVADANQRGAKGFEAGPGVRFTLPIFNQNQGAIARADAELERAVRQRRTIQDRVILEVRESHDRLTQAREDLVAWRDTVIPSLDEATRLAERSYVGGATSLVQVADTYRQLLEARLREAQADADVRRARAELERSVGRRLEAGVADESPSPQEGKP